MTTAAHPRHSKSADNLGHQVEKDFDEDDHAIQVAAAQLRIVTDRRLGKTTPGWVRALAEEAPRKAS